MPLHPQAAAFLQRRNRAGVRPDHELTVAQARANAEQTPDPATLEPVGHIQERLIRGLGVKHPVRIRIYTPSEPPLGVVLYLHGGGHVTGTINSYDTLTRRLTNRVPANVVAVDYRRVPEHRCPAAVDDAETAYRWVLSHAQRPRDQRLRIRRAGRRQRRRQQRSRLGPAPAGHGSAAARVAGAALPDAGRGRLPHRDYLPVLPRLRPRLRPDLPRRPLVLEPLPRPGRRPGRPRCLAAARHHPGRAAARLPAHRAVRRAL